MGHVDDQHTKDQSRFPIDHPQAGPECAREERRLDNRGVRRAEKYDDEVGAGGSWISRCVLLAPDGAYHPRLVEDEDEPLSHESATSAASSLALLVFLPSYQNRALRVVPWTLTVLDQAVRPPVVS